MRWSIQCRLRDCEVPASVGMAPARVLRPLLLLILCSTLVLQSHGGGIIIKVGSSILCSDLSTIARQLGEVTARI